MVLSYSGGGKGYYPCEKEINIKFIKSTKEKSKYQISFINNELNGLLRLYLLKEISKKVGLKPNKKIKKIVNINIIHNGIIKK